MVAGKTFPAFPAHAQPAILRIWQEAHWGNHHSQEKKVDWDTTRVIVDRPTLSDGRERSLIYCQGDSVETKISISKTVALLG